MQMQHSILFSTAADLTTFCRIYISLDTPTGYYPFTEGDFMANLFWQQQWKIIQSSCKVPSVCVCVCVWF